MAGNITFYYIHSNGISTVVLGFTSPTEGQVITNTASGSETTFTVNYAIVGQAYYYSNSKPVLIYVYDENWNLLYKGYVSTDNAGNFTYSSSTQFIPGSHKLIVSSPRKCYWHRK